EQARGPRQPAAAGADELVEELAGQPVVAQDVVGRLAGDVEVVVGPEDHAAGPGQPAAARRDEGLQGGAVEADDAVAEAGGGVEGAVGPEDDAGDPARGLQRQVDVEEGAGA